MKAKFKLHDIVVECGKTTPVWTIIKVDEKHDNGNVKVPSEYVCTTAHEISHTFDEREIELLNK